MLDWFHITMRLTVLGQCARGVAHHGAAEGARLLASLDSIKWLLCHGNQHRAGEEIALLEDDVDGLAMDTRTWASSNAPRTSSPPTSPATPAA